MIARIIDGQLQQGLPYTGVLLDGRTVSSYNLLPDNVLLAEGWLPVVENIPTYDEDTQTVVYDGYSVLSDRIIINYIISDL